MGATKNIITTDSEFINATSRLDNIQRKFEDVSPIWKSGKLRSEMTDKEIKILSEYEDMMDSETIGIKVGDKVAYRLDGYDEIYSGTVIDILDRGDIRTDTDGVLCAGQYAKINTTPTETSQISTQTTETANVPVEGEKEAERAANKPETYTGMNAYNVEYYVRRFGTIANLDKEYEAAMNAVRCEKDEYYFKRHKGGRFRTERIAELDRKLKALGLEWMQIRRAMNEYFKEHAKTVIQPPQSPEAPQTVECAAEPCKLAQTA